MQLAIVHDYLNQFGGAERVVCELSALYREAPIYTSIYNPDLTWPELKDASIRTSWLQRLPFSHRYFKLLLPFYPSVFGGLKLSGYDVILSSSSSFAKGVQTDEGTIHICYCHSPTRFLWFYDDYVRKERYAETLKRLPFPVVGLMVYMLRNWDLVACHRPDYYIANSVAVQGRIRKIYHRDSCVIHPPVDVERFRVSTFDEGYYLVVSRLIAYKRIDLVIQTFNELGLPLVVVGDGPQRRVLEKMAQSNIYFKGHLPDQEVNRYFEGCRAFIFPGEEDFGITPLEANACGKPVIAYASGGALDSVQEGLNGVFFHTQTVSALKEAILSSTKMEWDPKEIRVHAEGFSPEVFKQKIAQFVQQVVTDAKMVEHVPPQSAFGTTS
jgi:glycosyltransferase involved in cell wall biosynthesis